MNGQDLPVFAEFRHLAPHCNSFATRNCGGYASYAKFTHAKAVFMPQQHKVNSISPFGKVFARLESMRV
jgi:hypothetical protein